MIESLHLNVGDFRNKTLTTFRTKLMKNLKHSSSDTQKHESY